MTHPQEGGAGGEVSEILIFSAKSKRRPSLIYSMQIIPVCLSIVARRKGVSATRRGGLNWTPISLLVGHPCKLFHTIFRILRKYSGSNATGKCVNPAKKAPKSPTASLQFQRTGAHLKTCLHGTAVIGRSKTATIGRETSTSERMPASATRRTAPPTVQSATTSRSRSSSAEVPKSLKRDATSICIVTKR